MNRLWNLIERAPWSAGSKARVAWLVLAAICGFLGFCLWLIIRPFALAGIDWMLCFIGYPFVLGWIGGFFYTTEHPFHDTTERTMYSADGQSFHDDEKRRQ